MIVDRRFPLFLSLYNVSHCQVMDCTNANGFLGGLVLFIFSVCVFFLFTFYCYFSCLYYQHCYSTDDVVFVAIFSPNVLRVY